jgi:hypothetical protein
MGIETNYLSVFIAALVYFGGGALWYSAVLFGKSWMRLVGLSEERIKEAQKRAWKSYLTALVAAFLISLGIARIEAYMNVITISGGLQTGFWAWLCFVVTTMATNNTFADRPLKLLIIDSGYHLYGFLVTGIILAVWK